LLNVVAGTGKELRQLRAEAITEYPQVLVNVRVDRNVDASRIDELWEEVKAVEEDLGDQGRVLVRPSGSEPLIRIMVEALTKEEAKRYADRLAQVTKQATRK
jgi:phosphoglucosamine mutase